MRDDTVCWYVSWVACAALNHVLKLVAWEKSYGGAINLLLKGYLVKSIGNLSVVSPEIYAKARSRVALKAPEIFVEWAWKGIVCVAVLSIATTLNKFQLM